MYTVTESNQRARCVLCRRRADAVQRSPSIIKHHRRRHQRHLSVSVRYVAMQAFQTRPPRPNEVAVVTTVAVIVSLALLSCLSLRFSDVSAAPTSSLDVLLSSSSSSSFSSSGKGRSRSFAYLSTPFLAVSHLFVLLHFSTFNHRRSGIKMTSIAHPAPFYPVFWPVPRLLLAVQWSLSFIDRLKMPQASLVWQGRARRTLVSSFRPWERRTG